MAAKEGELSRSPDSQQGAPFDTTNCRRPSDLRGIFREFLRYGAVSAAALALDAALLKTLVSLMGWNYLPASVLSFFAGAILAYVLSVRYVFRFRGSKNQVWEFVSFVVLGIVGLLINSLILSLAIGVAGLGLITAKLIAAGFTFGTNFFLRRQLLFSNVRNGGKRKELSSFPEQDSPD